MNRTVAIYARVSTEHEAQLSALENQVQYYDNILAAHPEWKLYKQYIDEGITGTSVNKRKSFMEMMRDAQDGCFDLIVTREVSRFARNTVDTLQETRKLRRIGVEVYFTEDNIWTMNDEDGELRLTIMATLAQNESKKTSIRVKAGQRISFQNGVFYGNGNILGYNRVGKDLIINPEQAETVRMIFDLYLQGNGSRKIAYELERRGRLTSRGCTHWDPANISHILRNPFYSGTIVYRKAYIPDYLEQKAKINKGEVENIVVEGKHQPIITKEEFEIVQKRMDSHSVQAKERSYGHGVSDNIWCKKLKCSCGSNFNRKAWSKSDVYGTVYGYQCYSQKKNGSIATRRRRGLSTEGYCDSPMFQEWKLELMIKKILEFFWEDKKKILNIANKLLEKDLKDGYDSEAVDKERRLTGKLNNVNAKLDNLIEMRINDDITREFFLKRKAELETEAEAIKKQIDDVVNSIKASETDVQSKVAMLKFALENNFEVSGTEIPESVIDTLVREVEVRNERFIWKLNIAEGELSCLVEGKRENATFTIDKIPDRVVDNTGCYSRKVEQSLE